jgi:diguanylate cyclase (GGDEF)-like protein/PAS domain S-box-containing protein
MKVFNLFMLCLVILLSPPLLHAEEIDKREGCDSCLFKINSLEKPYDLTGQWLFSRKDSEQNKAVNLDTSDWELIKAPGPWTLVELGKIFTVGWCRGVFEFPPELIGQKVVVFMDTYLSRTDIYLDGNLIFRRPDPERFQSFYPIQSIPAVFTISKTRHVFTFRIQGYMMTGPYQLPLKIQKFDAKARRAMASSQFWGGGGQVRLLAAYIGFGFGLFFLLVYFKTRELLYLMASLVGVSIFPFFGFPGESFINSWGPEVSYILHYLGLFVSYFIYLFIQYFTGWRPKLNKYLGVSCLVSAALFPFAAFVYRDATLILIARYLCVSLSFAVIFCACNDLFRAFWKDRGNKDLRTLSIGLAIAVGTALNDGGIDFGLYNSYGMLSVGFIILVASILWVASIYFGNTFWENKKLATNLKVINDNLEDLVAKRTEQFMQSEEKYRTILESIQEGYFEVDLNGKFTFCNNSMSRLTGCSKEELLGMNHKQFTNEETAKEVFQAFDNVYTTGEPSKGFDWQIIRKDGVELFIETSVTLQKDSSGKPAGFKGMIRDITERKRMEQQLNYMATHDALTGLPNRLMFNQLLNQAIRSAQRHKRQLAVFFIDLDRFKAINDSLGHEAGDRLLKEMAKRFKKSLRAVDVVGRLGGDEFVIFIEEVEEFRQVEIVAHKLLSSAIKPMVLQGEECRVTASIGISIYPKDGLDEQSLMKNADIAMYFAKEEGKNNHQFFSKDIQSQSNERLSLETNLRSALERKEFSLHYQAKVDFKTGEITGVEALLRWDNPYLGSVTPTQFIPVAEETGLIVPIGRWVMKTACAQNVAWQRQGLPSVCMAVNLSLRQLMDDKLLEDIKAALDDSGMAPNLLELEITESMLMHNPARLIAVLTNIKKMGVRLAIDDFGTGYASLAQIKNFPIDTLKVDRSFIRNLPQDSENRAITQAIIAMGKTLSLTVVAEGVETQAQKDFLQDHICDEMQGFYFSKPVAPDNFADLLRNNNIPSQK